MRQGQTSARVHDSVFGGRQVSSQSTDEYSDSVVVFRGRGPNLGVRAMFNILIRVETVPGSRPCPCHVRIV